MATHPSYQTQSLPSPFSAMVLSLPNELILDVVENFTDTTDVYYLMMTCKHLSNVLQPVIEKASKRIQDSAAGSYLPLLHLAAARNERSTAKLALKLDPGCLNRFVSPEGTALHLAVFEGFESMVEFLLNQGADPNPVDPNPHTGAAPDTPLHVALANAIEIEDVFIVQTVPMINEGITRLLVQRGANPNALDSQGMNALLHAARLGMPSIIAAILDTGLIDINSRSPMGRTALHIAVTGSGGTAGSLQVAELLLERGIDVDARDVHHEPALFEARTEDMTALLLKYGATIGMIDRSHRTVLHYLADYPSHIKSAAIATLILNTGGAIDVGLKDFNNKSALYYALARNNFDLIMILDRFQSMQ